MKSFSAPKTDILSSPARRRGQLRLIAYPRILGLTLSLGCIPALQAADSDPVPPRNESLEMSDASIREIVRIVARHQRDVFGATMPKGEILPRPALEDGDYASIEQFATARRPGGIAWDSST